MAVSAGLRRALAIVAFVVLLCALLGAGAVLWFERGRTQAPPPFTLSPAVTMMRLGLGRLGP